MPAAADAERYVLRCLADLYEQTQRIRIATGERIRAYLQARDGSLAAEACDDPEARLREIRNGVTDGPIPLLGQTYRRHWLQERELRKEMAAALEAHPVYEWIDGVRGVGPTLACKLLARLDVTKARQPSSFWRYCGLATSAQQNKNGGYSYDKVAKRVCYLLGTSLTRFDPAYRELFRCEMDRLNVQRPEWSAAHRRFAALRKVEKRFLLDLWIEWNYSIGRSKTLSSSGWSAAREMITIETD